MLDHGSMSYIFTLKVKRYGGSRAILRVINITLASLRQSVPLKISSSTRKPWRFDVVVEGFGCVLALHLGDG
jgi:hypothetical protein